MSAMEDDETIAYPLKGIRPKETSFQIEVFVVGVGWIDRSSDFFIKH
jgi:hypothetical protein